MKENKDILNSEEIQAISKQFIERLEKEEKACKAYENLLCSYGLAPTLFEVNTYEGQDIIECKLGEGKAQLKGEDYPDYYGGSYINDDGKLAIHVVGNIAECQAEIETIIGNTEDFITTQAIYSYKELLLLKEKIENLDMNEGQERVFKNITAYGPNDKENLFVVEMNILDRKHITDFKELISNSEMIVFRKGDFEKFQTTVRAGQGVWNSQNGRSTATIRARQNPSGPMGFIMSGHGTRHLGEVIRNGSGSSATPLGQIAMRHWAGNVDAAFCRTSGVTLSPQFAQAGMGAAILGPGIANAPVDTSVFFAGNNSGIVSGRVTATNLNINVGGVSMTGLSRANFQVEGGDSGGPVYRLSNGQRPIIGNIISRNNTTGQGSFGLIAPILSRFNLRLTL